MGPRLVAAPITLRVALACVLLFAAGVVGVNALSGPPRQGVVIGYQTGVDPGKLAQIDGTYARRLGVPVTWRKFDSGTDVITALAAGDIDFGNIGSSPMAIAATRALPIKVIVLASRLGASEELVARNGSGINTGADLAGKRVATPFVSTSHYSLLAALAHWHIAPGSVHIINLSPPQIAAAWARGDIDAAYVWNPALGALKANGHVLAGSDDCARWGSPTYDGWVVRRDYADAHPRVVSGFVEVTLDAMRRWRAEQGELTAGSAPVKALAALTGARAADVPGLLASNAYPDAAEQAGPVLFGGGLARDLRATAAFLKAQGKVDRVLPDYSAYIDPRWVSAAARKDLP